MRRINIYIERIAEIVSIIFDNPIPSDPHILPNPHVATYREVRG